MKLTAKMYKKGNLISLYKIQKIIFKLIFAPKTWHPVLFPFVYLIAHLLHHGRCNINSIILSTKRNNNDADHLKELSRKGYVVIHNYLDSTQHREFKKAYLREVQKNSSSNFGDSIRFGLKKEYLSNINSLNINLFRDKLKTLSSHLIPHIRCGFERYRGDYDGQQNELFHVDTYHPTFKLFYYPNNVESYPFEFIEGSHKFSWNHFIFNFTCQLKNFRREVKCNKLKFFFATGFKGGSWRLNETDVGIAKLSKEKSVSTFRVPENTAVIVNTAGFHRRSTDAISANPERNMMVLSERSSIVF